MCERLSQVETVVAADADGFDWLDDLFGNSGNARNQFNGRAWFESAPQRPILIDYGVDATCLWIHHDDGAGMMTQRRYCGFADFEVLTNRAVFGDVRPGFVAHAFIDGALARDCCLPRSFRTTTGFFQCATMSGLELAHLCGQFAFAELMAGALLKFCNICRLFSCAPRLLGPSL